jgi:hypothetical protein
MTGGFDLERFFPRTIMDAITDMRVNRPDLLEEAGARRRRRGRLALDGKLNILACDHPARGMTAILDQPLAMGDRRQYMGRVVRALLDPKLDGVMAHTDLVEDLLVLDFLLVDAGGRALLDDRVVAGCMNRGGIAGVAGEIHDRFTAFSAGSLARLRLDGGKMLLRIVDDDERTLVTLGECAEAVTALARQGLVAFVEPLPMKGKPGAYSSDYTVETLVKWVGVCAGLGETSRNTWLKVPYVDPFEPITLATTLPILLLGGPAERDPLRTLEAFAAGMRSGRNVRGAMVGRNVLYPGGDDPLAMTAAVGAIIHDGADARAALERMDEARGRDLDAITRIL